MIALTLALLAAGPPPPPRTGEVFSAIHSEPFKRQFGEKTQAFRADYAAQLTWSLGEQKSCFFNQCHRVCVMTISHKLLSRQLWWMPVTGPAVLAQNSPAQREYAGGGVTFERPCAAVTDAQVRRAANERLRPYQFADELIRDRAQLMRDTDAWLHINPPTR